MKIIKGNFKDFGAKITENGVNFAIFSKNARQIDICIFDEFGRDLIAAFPLFKNGDIFHAEVLGIGINHTYAYRINGEFAPENGNRFDPQKLILDPYSLELSGELVLHDDMMVFGTDTQDLLPKTKIINPPIFEQEIFKIPDEKRIIYELNIKGFSALNKNLPPEIRGTFKGLAAKQSIDYLKSLGVNSVELMPCAAWIDERHLKKLGLKNYWGYNPICFMSPDPKLAPNGWADVQEAVKALNDAGIEVLIDVVFNHSGESDEFGPTISMRGIDNQTYYRLNEDKSKYTNDAGTGNVLQCDNPIVTRFVMDSLRAWVKYGGISGFRFDLAPILTRTKEGVDFDAPLMTAMAQDEVLKNITLIAEPWDIGYGGYQLGKFPLEWAEWNDNYRDIMRKFWLEDNVTLGAFAHSFCGTQGIFHQKTPTKSVNFIVAHDGFTLRDLVSYNQKHNDANGENNNDGHSDNHSNNHGFEGETNDETINSKRLKTQKALIATLLLSRGTPMICMGMENGKTQYGNNNAYAQDNEITYIDWSEINAELFDFTKKLIEIRKNHSAIFNDEFLLGQPSLDNIHADIEWRNADNNPLHSHDWENPHIRRIGITLTNRDDRVFIAINGNNDGYNFTLPSSDDGYVWELLLATSKTDNYHINPKSIAVFSQKPDSLAKYPPKSETLNKLANALGIDSEWWDVNGNGTQVADETKTKIITAMGYDCNTENECLLSLKQYSDKFERRILPFYQCFDENEAVFIDIYIHNNTSRQIIVIKGENEEKSFPLETYETIYKTNKDGVNSIYLRLKIESLAVGRYQIWLKSAPDIKCALTIAPKSAYLPEILKTQKVAGLSSQIYATKRNGDLGIGDFTNLKQVLDYTQSKGLAILGINPLHALFPFKRDRISPYYPSDRRFIEPHYIDCEPFTTQSVKIEKSDIIDYKSVWQIKEKILEGAFEKSGFKGDDDKSLLDFATFQTLSEKFNGKSWQEWDTEYRDKDTATIAKFQSENAKRINYHKYLQSICDEQLKQAINHDLAIGLCRDLAIGSAPDGAEGWAMQSLSANNISIGAPPDPLGPKGQVWGLPPFNPLKLIETNCANYIELFQTNMKYAGALRIDHAMGLMRQFWVPNGLDGNMGAYVNFPFKQLLGELKLESHRAKCLIIGEDLGTVPHGFSENMQAQNIFSYKVLPFEQDNFGYKSPDSYPTNSFTCGFTHDLPPLLGWWNNADIEIRLELGIFTLQEAEDMSNSRQREKDNLINAIIANGLLDEKPKDLNQKTISAIHRFLSKTNAKIAIAQLEDLAQMTEMINLPGTSFEYPNWQKKIHKNLDEIFAENNIFADEIIKAITKNRIVT